MVPLMASPTAVRSTALATASAAMGWMSAGERRTVLPSVSEWAIPWTIHHHLKGAPVQRLLDREHDPGLEGIDIGGEVVDQSRPSSIPERY
jgi:hypothetical protein